uniref:Uncharacterized protein n=1 Tax=Fagus sylvatica TaxID=28930 RepID=A0A2N9GG76_FAGSY
MGEAASFHDGLLDDSAILRTALSLVSSRRSRFKRSCPSFSSSLWKVVLRVVNPISTGITASVPKHVGRALDGCQSHIQARGEHMKTREKGRSSLCRRVEARDKGRLRVDGKVVTPAARGKEGLLSDGAWKSVTTLMMKISPGVDRSGDDLHRSGVCFPSLKRLRVDRKVVTSAARGKEGLLSDGAWKSVTTLMMKISPGVDRSGDDLHRSGVCFPPLKAKKEVWRLCNFYTASQELKLLENQLTAIKRAEERKTCKRQESDRSGHRFGAGLVIWSWRVCGCIQLRAWCWATLRGAYSSPGFAEDTLHTDGVVSVGSGSPVKDKVFIFAVTMLLSSRREVLIWRWSSFS